MVKGEESTEPKYSGKDSGMSFEKLDEKSRAGGGRSLEIDTPKTFGGTNSWTSSKSTLAMNFSSLLSKCTALRYTTCYVSKTLVWQKDCSTQTGFGPHNGKSIAVKGNERNCSVILRPFAKEKPQGKSKSKES